MSKTDSFDDEFSSNKSPEVKNEQQEANIYDMNHCKWSRYIFHILN